MHVYNYLIITKMILIRWLVDNHFISNKIRILNKMDYIVLNYLNMIIAASFTFCIAITTYPTLPPQ